MRKSPILHPSLFAAYPAVTFMAHNIEQAKASDALRPLLLSLAGAALVYFTLKAILRDSYKVGIVTSIWLGLFFTYGHAYTLIEGARVMGVTIGRHRLLAPVWLGLAGLALWWGTRRHGELCIISQGLNAISVVLLLLPLGQISVYQLSVRMVNPVRAVSRAHASAPLSPIHGKPDIYYIILDSYSRDDMLKKYYRLDNTPFLSQLDQLSFYVARCAQSNYSQTELSLASSLNYAYLDELGDQFRPGNTRRAGLIELIQHSVVRTHLENLGYTIVALDTGYDPTRLTDADVYLAPRTRSEINDFEETFVRTTAARLIVEGVASLNLPPDWKKRDQAHRERILYELEQLRHIPDLPGPKFVFAHIITPHWPYIFGPNGEPVHERPESETGYRDQVIFINQQILPILQNIIARSKTAPIIIIQGDHGAVLDDPQRRMTILNAYYLPEGGAQSLYEAISPVNTFRVIFNVYFGLQAPLLDDISYYSTYEEPYNYMVVENTRPGCQ
jgi:hypothetical protein